MILKKFYAVALAVFFVCVMVACQKLLPPAPASEDVLAEPLPDLTPTQENLHLLGDGEFARVFSQQEGLGPVFVQASCESCHAGDGKGNPFNNLTRFGKYDPQGAWDPMLSQGGPQLQNRCISGFYAESLPEGCASSEFLAPSASGLGYLEAVEDATILALADSMDTNGDGISGRVHWVKAPSFYTPKSSGISSNGLYIGRFGRKAMALDLLHQTVGAYKQDMGITSPFDMYDPVNYSISGSVADNVADPEISSAAVQNVAFYLRTLKAPPRRNTGDADVMAGEALFIQIGCESCHTSTLTTGASEIKALNFATFHPYTDMLLHDMGWELNDNYTEGTALVTEWRTTPLWGLGIQKDSQGGQMFLMHDGRAKTFDHAIQLHGGEGAASRAAYNALSEGDKQKLIKFLESL